MGDDDQLSGYYFREARFLRTLRREINHRSPWPCEATVLESNALAFTYIYPELTEFGGGGSGQSGDDASTDADGIPHRALSLRVLYTLGIGGLTVRLMVSNHAARPIEIDVAWTLDADFADIQEAHEGRREQQAAVQRRTDDDQLHFIYQHSQLKYRTVVAPTGSSPWAVTESRITTRIRRRGRLRWYVACVHLPRRHGTDVRMENHDFNTAIVDEIAHRPWAMPDGPWVMTQTWHDLLFAHWPVEHSQLRSVVPTAFELDLFHGEAWIGIVPFHMTNVAPRGLPSLPWVSAFPELNVRTYVLADDRPGVYFFSLDAGSRLAVQAARRLLNLPYYSASMTVSRIANGVEYRSTRDADPTARFDGTYEPAGVPFVAARGSLEYFLTERYCLYHLNHRGAPYRLDIHHPPWSLQQATAKLARNTMAEVNRIRLPDRPPVLHFAKRQDMVAWAPSSLR